MSSIETPRSLAWVRSMISSSQGVSARKLVNSPCKLRVVLAGGDDLVGGLLQGRQAVVAGVLDDDLEAAGRAQALDRRRAEDVDDRLAAPPSGSAPAASRRCASPDSSGRVRFSKSSSITYIAPKLEALAFSRIDWPAMATVCLTPGVFRAISSICCDHVLRARHRGGVGQLHVDQQIALVLLRDEAGRRVREAPLGQDQQAAVDQQHQHADAQQARRPAACRALVEQSKPRLNARNDQPSRQLSGRPRSQPDQQARQPPRPRSAPRARRRPASPARRCRCRRGQRRRRPVQAELVAQPGADRHEGEPRQRLEMSLARAAAAAAPTGPG